MFNTKLTVEKRVQKAVARIMAEPRYDALAGVLMIGTKSVRDDIPTACTNGRDEMYGRKFVEGLSDPELRFLVLHECYHKLYRHLTTWAKLYKQNPRLANAACDYVINLKISDENKDGFATFINGGLINEKYRGMNTLQVYNDLKQQQQQQPQNGRGGGEPQGGEDGLDTLDDHDWEGATELGAEEKRQLERDIDEAIRQGALTAGKTGSGSDRLLGDLLQPQVNWREKIREFITEQCRGNDFGTWARPNRRYAGAGIYMPTALSERVDELIIAIDTSGSIGDAYLNAFMSEVKSVIDTVKPERVRILYWGSEVVGDELYDEHNRDTLIQSTKPVGGGGTDVRCVTRYIADKKISAQACIVLTDGYLYDGWGAWTMPTLWAICDNKSAKPDCGKVVHINSENL